MRGWSRVEQTFGGEAIAIIRRDDTIIIDNAFTRMVRRPIFIDSAFFLLRAPTHLRYYLKWKIRFERTASVDVLCSEKLASKTLIWGVWGGGNQP